MSRAILFARSVPGRLIPVPHVILRWRLICITIRAMTIVQQTSGEMVRTVLLVQIPALRVLPVPVLTACPVTLSTELICF